MTPKSGVMFLKNSPLCRGHVSEKGVGNVSEKHALKWGHDPDKSHPTGPAMRGAFSVGNVLAGFSDTTIVRQRRRSGHVSQPKIKGFQKRDGEPEGPHL